MSHGGHYQGYQICSVADVGNMSTGLRLKPPFNLSVKTMPPGFDDSVLVYLFTVHNTWGACILLSMR